ncbi:hypothetical protein M0R45_000598 [Rubus argutus]|uniref:TMV resistance protein N n=1 Tax=Rubus argutus TaxID=59490 RepID=A0AAW1VMW3_RUBAR
MSTNFEVAKYPVGIESRVEDVLKLLHVGENDVRMVGIWGIGGIGKTTIAKAVYNSIVHRFEGSCFLENVKEPRGGLVQVQNLFLSKILGEKELHINNVDIGVHVIKKRLGNKRVLIIFDDVNELKQLNKLVGNCDWFGSGSRIIITTRDKRWLTAHDIDQVYEVKELSDHESLELFKLSAFKEEKHMDDYSELLENVILYAQGVPLVLEVLGSDLRGRHVDQWKVVLDSYAKEPNQEIQNKLRISYDGLQDSMKEIFLHIACFFKGNDKNYVIDILEACDLNPERGIEVLKEKALIKITQADSIQMHDLLEEMGKEIVRQESPHESGERSRLWRYEDVNHIFVKNSGTNKVKGIMVTDSIPKKICLSSESFSKLKNLQIFMISNDIFYGDHIDSLSNELRFLDWKYCPLQSFPSDFVPTKLVLLNMPSSQTSPLGDISKILFGRKMPWSCKSPWDKGLKNIQTLKSIDLPCCLALRKIPDFSRFPNLVDLNVRGCENLIEVDPSIGLLKKLVNLDLSHCSKLGQFEIVDKMKSLKYLNLGETAIKQLSSSSIGCLINLEKLSLSGCDNLIDVPCCILELQHLQHLDLAWCKNLVTFPTKSEFSTNTTIQYDPLFVNLSCCNNLIEISEFPREIDSLHVSYCFALKRISKLSNILEGKESKMTRMKLNGCDQLCHNLAHDYVAKMKCRFKSLPDDSQVTALLSLFLSSCRQSELKVSFSFRSRVPEWFTCRTDFETFSYSMDDDGLCVYNFSIEIPGNFKWENKGLAFCAQREKSSETVISTFKFCGIYINGVCITEKSKTLGSLPWLLSGYVWLHYIPFDTIIRRLSTAGLPPPSICQVQYVFRYETSDFYFDHVVEGSCGVHVVMPEDDGVFVNGSSNPVSCSSSINFMITIKPLSSVH